MTFTPVANDLWAKTEVSVLKYDKNTFNLILDQFQDMKEDIQLACED